MTRERVALAHRRSPLLRHAAVPIRRLDPLGIALLRMEAATAALRCADRSRLCHSSAVAALPGPATQRAPAARSCTGPFPIGTAALLMSMQR
ncbi:MAG: hypothetical protein DI564_09800 [Rhodanobacter denitrificans]|uniref:Uncharacterized protein n=1 Tax=Rhodanobacter denitrificans TaxID=666685 RepID=A0A2W5KCE1_9GAMM|nr:MAG: hypothetical protein DI564_09800 [Rhodanobacter denitrificans]